MLSEFATSFLVKHPDTAAASLENIDVEALAAIAGSLEPAAVAPIFGHMLPQRVAAALALLAPARAAAVLDQLEFSQSIRIMYQFEPAARTAIIARMHPPTGNSLARALNFPPGTVGRIMSSRIDVFRPREAAERAVAALRQNGNSLPICFVIDERQRPLGVVEVATLLRTPGSVTLGEVMNHSAATVSSLARLESIREAVLADGLDYLAVVDSDHRLIGALNKVEWTREMELGVEPAESLELVSLWLGVANMFWQAGARMVANSANPPPSATEPRP